MDKYTIEEVLYKNGYEKGYQEGKKEATGQTSLGKPYIEEIYGHFARCMECGKRNMLPSNYCRNCGRKIVGVVDEQA